MRTTRVLLGWMPASEGQLWLAARREHERDLNRHVERAIAARGAVAARATRSRARDVLREAVPELIEYEARLRGAGTADAYFRDGWKVVLADLHQLRVCQPLLYCRYAAQLVAGAHHDVMKLAESTLPLEYPAFPESGFDERRQAWVLSSSNSNVAVTGSYKRSARTWEYVFGFTVRLQPSFVNVAEIGGRFVLRDGYHRSVGAYLHGVRWLPVFARSFPTWQSVGLPKGFLDEREVLGDRGPTIPDYFDDTVSAGVRLSPPRKEIVVQALDLLTIQ